MIHHRVAFHHWIAARLLHGWHYEQIVVRYILLTNTVAQSDDTILIDQSRWIITEATHHAYDKEQAPDTGSPGPD